ncbi:hypothetical protein ACTXIM_13605 [Pseudoalteromonas nigrifaciens]|uniref:hypothetical protein n=1 Tax=Pseudoalteromonas nigrifaciens TaxID=28109 RepID=UPI001787CE85|nr:hypothetical protein [Pseudoalteromonas nigrifaciens]MBE0421823.1 hypothetical protein [Pseudoalteromonas nigrifaciens]
MSNTLTILPNPKTILVANTTPANTTALASTEAETWQISENKGTISGVGVTVSGAGAWAKMSGSFDFSIVNLESSHTYQKMVSEYSISGVLVAFGASLVSVPMPKRTNKKSKKQCKNLVNSKKLTAL